MSRSGPKLKPNAAPSYKGGHTRIDGQGYVLEGTLKEPTRGRSVSDGE